VGNPKDTNLTFYRNNKIIAKKNGTVNDKHVTATVTIELMVGTNALRCEATNVIGSSNSSDEVTVSGK